MAATTPRTLSLPSEMIGSIPRSATFATPTDAVRVTVAKLEELHGAGDCICDGEQTKPSFITYPLTGATNLAAAGAVIPFADAHTRQLPVLAAGPFAYTTYAVEYLRAAKPHVHADRKIKQAVISASAMSLLYPATGIDGYSRDQFLNDVVTCAVRDIRECLEAGAAVVQIDFTEGRLSLKLDPTGALLDQMIALNECVISAFSAADKAKIGIHVCPGADKDSTHSADVPYDALLPKLLNGLSCGRFYLALKCESNPEHVLGLVRSNLKKHQMIFIGVTDVNNPKIESAEEVCDLVTLATKFVPLKQLGTCDDCGFSPFADDDSTSRTIAFAKIAARLEGTQLARERLAALKKFFHDLLAGKSA